MLFTKARQLSPHLVKILLELVCLLLFEGTLISGPKVLKLLRHLHREEAANFDILDDLAWQIVCVMRKLLNELLDEALVVIANHATEILLNVRTTCVANLVAFNAHLRHRKRQDLNLLEPAVHNQASLEACRV